MPASGTIATISDILTPPTPSEIAEAVTPLVLGTSISTVTDVAVGSLGTLILGRLASRIDGNEQVIYQLDGTTEHTRLTVVLATEDIPDIAGMLLENE